MPCGLEAVLLSDGSVWNGLTGLREGPSEATILNTFSLVRRERSVLLRQLALAISKPADIQTAFVAVKDAYAAVELLARARQLTDDRVVTFEYMPRDAIAFALKHIDGTRDPMSTPHQHYVLMELAAGEAAAAGLRRYAGAGAD